MFSNILNYIKIFSLMTQYLTVALVDFQMFTTILDLVRIVRL
jgi:hypothetical protein